MSTIQLGTASTGEQVTIDISTLVSTRLLVTASSGGGKSETLRRILEEASQHIQCIVIDPEGEFSTLREKRPFVLVGEGGETAADIRTAAMVATRLLELNVSAVCDLYEMRVQDRHEWVKRFLDAMVHAPKSLWHPVLVIIDEAHAFAPEKGYGESVAAQSVIDIANLGRKRGFCLIPATQRLSKLSKNVVEPMQNYLVGRTTFDDQARAASVFKIAPGAATRSFSTELERLNAGQFIARGRAITGDLLKVQVTRGMTRPPATGTAMAGLVTPTPEALRALLPKFADLPQEAERQAQTVEELQRELAEAKRKLAAKPAIDQDEVDSLKAQLESKNSWSMGIAKTADARGHAMMEAVDKLEEIMLDLRMASGSEEFAPQLRVKSEPKPADLAKADPATVNTPGLKQASVVTTWRIAAASSDTSTLPKGERSVLTVLAQHGPSKRLQISVFTGFARSTRDAYIQRLSGKGFVETSGDAVSVTPAGSKALGRFDPLPTGKNLRDWWISQLPAGEARVLELLCNLGYSKIADRDFISEKTGFARSTRDAYIQRLASKLLVEVTSAGVRAVATLF